ERNSDRRRERDHRQVCEDNPGISEFAARAQKATAARFCVSNDCNQGKTKDGEWSRYRGNRGYRCEYAKAKRVELRRRVGYRFVALIERAVFDGRAVWSTVLAGHDLTNGSWRLPAAVEMRESDSGFQA